MPTRTLIGLPFLTLFSACSMAGGEVSAQTPPEIAQTQPSAPVQAPLTAADGSIAGQVIMRRGPQGILLEIQGQGWPEGWHGVHLHAVGSCEAPAFTSAGGHVNDPHHARSHGLLNLDGGPDFGDLQNVYAHSDGTARAEVYLHGDATSSRGLALVVHTARDDHVSQPIGGAGGRIACAVLVPSPETD